MQISDFKRRNPIHIALLVGLLVIIGGSLYATQERQKLGLEKDEFDVSAVLPPSISQPPTSSVFSQEDLRDANGKDGNDCYVAIKGAVYEILQGRLWTDGEHTTSNGQAYCGLDLTEVLKDSPHGESKLSEAIEIGVLQD